MVSDLKKLKELPKVKTFDIEEYDGIKSKIEKVEFSDIKKMQGKNGEYFSQNLIVSSIKLGGTDERPILAREYLPLKYDEELETFGIPESTNSKAIKFLKFFKVNTFDEVIGKEIMIVKRVSEKGEFLGIHYG